MLDILLKCCLFILIFLLLYQILVPRSRYELTPATIAADIARQRLREFFTSGDNLEKLSIINRTPEMVMKYAINFGLGLGLLVAFFTFKYAGILSLLLGIGAALLGIFLTRHIIEKEFEQWQAGLLLGISPLASFMPAYLQLDVLVVSEALAYTSRFLPQPFKGEIEAVLNRFNRDGQVHEALDQLAYKARHPIIDAVCYRLAMAWDYRADPDLFKDLVETIEIEKEKAAGKITNQKIVVQMAMVGIALVGIIPIFGYPGIMILKKMVDGGVGF